MKLATLPFLLLAPLVTPLVTPPLVMSAGQVPESPFPPSREPLSIPGPGEEMWSIEDLVLAYGRVTGQVIHYTKEQAGLMINTRVNLSSGVHVPPENVHSVVEALLIHNDFVFLPVHPDSPRIVGVVNLNTGARNTMRQNAITVMPDQIDLYADHPAFLVTTTLTLDHLDVRQISNSLRTMLTDANTQNIIPVGSSNSLILTGFGPKVVALTRILTQVNEEARKYAERMPKLLPDAKKAEETPPSHER